MKALDVAASPTGATEPLMVMCVNSETGLL